MILLYKKCEYCGWYSSAPLDAEDACTCRYRDIKEPTRLSQIKSYIKTLAKRLLRLGYR
jgi:hypothetical protein